jgi:hypothetical protein
MIVKAEGKFYKITTAIDLGSPYARIKRTNPQRTRGYGYEHVEISMDGDSARAFSNQDFDELGKQLAVLTSFLKF